MDAIKKYDRRAKWQTAEVNLNHAGYMLVLIHPLMKQCRKKFAFKAGMFDVNTLSCLLLTYLSEHYKSKKVNDFFFKNGYNKEVHYRQKCVCKNIGLMTKISDREYVLTPKGIEVVEFICRGSIRSVGVFKELLSDFVTANDEIFI